MLERLSVRGLGIIDAVELEFAAGFAALTGETGAGKSLLVESLKLLGGQRAQSDMVRSGDDRLQVEGVFSFAHDTRIEEILDDLRKGAFSIRIQQTQLESAADRLGRRAFSGLVVGALIIAGAILLSEGNYWLGGIALGAGAGDLLLRHRVGFHRLLEPVEIFGGLFQGVHAANYSWRGK